MVDRERYEKVSGNSLLYLLTNLNDDFYDPALSTDTPLLDVCLRLVCFHDLLTLRTRASMAHHRALLSMELQRGTECPLHSTHPI